MAVVFVHGVNNRKDEASYEGRRQITESFFARTLQGITLNGKKLVSGKPDFPYWGDLGVSFAWNMGALPSGKSDALGPSVDDGLRPLIGVMKDALAAPESAAEEPLLTLAKHSFPRAVDVIVELAIQNGKPEDTQETALFVVAAQTYAATFEGQGSARSASPSWLAGMATDNQLITELLTQLKPQPGQQSGAAQTQSLGIFSSIGNGLAAGAAKLKKAVKDSAEKVLDRAGDFASTQVLAWNRRSWNGTLGRFFGDVFVYMNGRGDKNSPGPIPHLILNAWDQAIAKTPGEPTVIIGHSLGGVISYDLLTHFRPDLEVDLFITIGSQVSHFEEMKLFRESSKDIPGAGGKRVKRPDNVKRWINVFDQVDVFSYSCKNVFDGVDDYEYDTKTYVIKAHGEYFQQARFYDRLLERVKNPQS